jgi:hypothetical protein
MSEGIDRTPNGYSIRNCQKFYEGEPDGASTDCEDELWAIRVSLVEALEAFMFIEQTRGGVNPHPPGTNRHRAFALAEAALKLAKGDV